MPNEVIGQGKRLLIIDDEENMRHMLTVMLSKSGYQVETAADGLQGLEMATQSHFDFILCDMKMPNMDGLTFLQSMKGNLESTCVIIMTAYGSMDTAIEAMKMGAYDYISKPFKADEVLLTLKKAEERENLRKENISLKERIQEIEGEYRFGKMVAKSSAMEAIFTLAQKVARYNTTVLIIGESGTGKELIARGIHECGASRDKPLIPVNCGGIPENLLESEFFGYKKGAFTGADRDTKGLFEEADGGTIFLDEIGELPLMLQVKLLRVLQENEVRRIGDSKTRSINVRVIAATAKDLEEEVKSGGFRQDLYYRLNVMPIFLPPLRERPEDIPILCRHFIRRFNKILNKNTQGISSEAMQMLMEHDWPGNVRELENVIQRAVVLCDEPILTVDSFPNGLGPRNREDSFDKLFETYSLKQAQKIIEKKLITRALTATKGNRTQATRLLEISHPSLLSKIKAYNIKI